MRSYPVFVDHRGNRFIFPGLYVDQEKSYDWGFCRTLCVALGVSEEKDRFDVTFDEDGSLTFEHIRMEMMSPGFAHGAEDVYIIGGPTFDEVKNGTYSND